MNKEKDFDSMPDKVFTPRAEVYDRPSEKMEEEGFELLNTEQMVERINSDFIEMGLEAKAIEHSGGIRILLEDETKTEELENYSREIVYVHRH